MSTFAVNQRVRITKIPEDLYPQEWIGQIGAVGELKFWTGQGQVYPDDPLYHIHLDTGKWAVLWGEEIEPA